MLDESSPKLDIGLSIFLITVCGIILWQAAKLPPGVFEPLGSAPVPKTVAWIIIGLCVIVIVNAIRKMRLGIGPKPEGGFEPRPLDAVGVLVMTALYVLVMQYRLTSFAIATTIMLIVTIGFLNRFRLSTMPWAVGIALTVAFGCQYLFTRVFVVDLPAT